MTLTYSEIISTLLLLAAVVGVWLDARLRINTLESTVENLKSNLHTAIHNFENSLKTHTETNDRDSANLLEEVKQIAKDNKETMSTLTKQMNDLKVLVIQSLSKKQ